MSQTTPQQIKKLRDDLAALHIRLSYAKRGLRREIEEPMILQEIKEVEEAIEFLEGPTNKKEPLQTFDDIEQWIEDKLYDLKEEIAEQKKKDPDHPHMANLIGQRTILRTLLIEMGIEIPEELL